MPKLIRRWRWAIGIAALLTAGLIWAFWPEPVLVDTGKVTRGLMTVGVTDDGVTRSEDYYVVSAPMTGYLSRIHLNVGDKVRHGTRIATMTATLPAILDARSQSELHAMLKVTRAGVQSAQTALLQSSRDFERARALSAQGFLPKAQLEQTKTRMLGQKAALVQAQGELLRIQSLLRPTPHPEADQSVAVRAPASGLIMSLVNESEGVIMQGTPLITIGDPSRIEVVVDLISRDAAQVPKGAPVLITQWGGPDPIIGYVKQVEPFGRLKVSALGIEEQRVNVIIGFPPSAAQRIKPLGHGYQIDAQILLWRRPDAVRVPIGALFRGVNGDWHVFVITGRRASERAVRIGHINDEYGEVMDGVKEGEAVILNPGRSLSDGALVAARQ